ncbi:stalk domain-containing protein [Paenibacillus paeoniae]|uniref:Copper amine oxidase-like N-terminal domain-containing protein n=1 Tax=Paenibacillus paeoniae TaxID=2292705 RepID=A0A371PKT0_9BACL|nr:stalk domain-containing protein [Paenibacillus paeoniae]REK76806.1 hypothetical protein DX130_07180 [Paenibacillus paeoniae]
MKSLLKRTMSVFLIVSICLLTGYQSEIHADTPIVQIENKKLETVIRNALNKPQGAITAGDMAKLQNLSSNINHITSLKGLEHAVNLKELYLVNSKINDLSPLSELHQLNSIYLADNRITDLSPLSGLKKIETLILERNLITDISPLQSMTSLIDLDLSTNLISDIQALRQVKNLERLLLGDNFIKDISSLAQLSKLTYLNAQGNLITDLLPVKPLNALWSLDVSNNKINDLTPVKHLKLIGISITNTDITDLTPIADSDTLTSIYVNESTLNPSSKAFLQQFKTDQHFVSGDRTYSAPKIFIDNQVQKFPVRPLQYNGRIMVPLRGLLEWIGADFSWNGTKRQITLKHEGSEIILTIDSNQIIVNGKKQTIDAKPYISDGYTLVPIRFIVETFGFHINWDDKRKWVMLTTKA